MMVEDIGGKSCVSAEDRDSLGKEDKAFGIVEVIAFGRTIQVFPIKELFPSDEINRDVLVQMAQIDFPHEVLLPHRDLNLFTQILEGKPGLPDHSVIRHD
jgi:hypothetical protein